MRTACVTVNFDPNSGGNPCGINAHLRAHLGSYDPTDQGLNYVGDVGSSITQPFSFEVPAQTDLVIVAHTNGAGGPANATCDFAFEVTMLPCDPALLIVPTLGEWAIICLAMLMMIFGVVAVNQKQLQPVRA